METIILLIYLFILYSAITLDLPNSIVSASKSSVILPTIYFPQQYELRS